MLLACASCATAFVVAGVPGLAGMGLGLSTGAFGAVVLYFSIAMLKGSGPLGRSLTLVAFILKFPVLGLGGFVAYGFGTEAVVAFAAGLVVVYSALIWRTSRSAFF